MNSEDSKEQGLKLYAAACIQLSELPDNLQRYAFQMISEMSLVGNGRCPMCNDQVLKDPDDRWYCNGCPWNDPGLQVQLIEEVQA